MHKRERLLLQVALVATAFCLMALSASHWWTHAVGTTRFIVIGLGACASVVVFYLAPAFASAKGQFWRRAALVLLGAALVTIEGAVRHEPIEGLYATLFPPPVASVDGNAAKGEKAVIQDKIWNIERALQEKNADALQSAIGMVDMALLNDPETVDGAIGPATRRAAAAAKASLADDLVPIETAINAAQSEERAKLLWLLGPWSVVGVLAVFDLLARFGLFGPMKSDGAAPSQQAPARVPDDYDRDAPIEELRGWWPARKDGSAPGPAPARHHWSRRVGAGGREGWYLKAYRRADLRLVHSA